MPAAAAAPSRPLHTPLLLLLLLLMPALLLGVRPAAAAAARSGGGATSASAAAAAEQQLAQLRRAVQQQPQDALAHVHLALALHELNHVSPDGGSRLPEAERAYRAALALVKAGQEQGGGGSGSSAYMHVQGNLGALLLSADRPAEAIQELQEALELGRRLRKSLAKQLRSTRKRQQQQQQQQQAKQQLEQQQQEVLLLQQDLEGVQQQLGGLMFNLGKALTSVGRLDEADAMYADAAAAALGHDFSSYGKALAASRAAPAEAMLQAAQVAKAAHGHFAAQPDLQWLASAAIDAPAGQQQQQQQQQQAELLGPWISAAKSMDLVWLHFALHKHHHTQGQYDLAWQYLDVGNRLMAALVRYDKSGDERNFVNIQRIFRAPMMTSGLSDRSAIFIVGMPRSGSTLLEQMLASHSQVFAAGEDTALAPLTTHINQALAAAPSQDHPQLLAHFGRLYLARMAAKVPHGWAGAPQQPQPQKDEQQQEAPAGAGASTGAAGSAGARHPASQPARIVDKMLRNLWLVGYINMLLPRACVVHVARHPLDVALSCYAQPFGYSAAALAWSWDLAAIAEQLRMAWALAEHWERQLPGRVHTVLYEELVARPEQTVARVLSACGLDWEPQVLEFHQAANRSVQTASMTQVRQPLYASAVGRWRAYEQQLRPLRESLAPLVARYEQLLAQHMEEGEGGGAGEGGSSGQRQLVADGPAGLEQQEQEAAAPGQGAQQQQQQQEAPAADVGITLSVGVRDEL